LGAHSAPYPDRYACTNHVLGNSSDNARAVDRKALESRVLTELCERMMTPEIAAEAMRACTQKIKSAQPLTPKLIGIHPPRASRSRESIAEIVCVIEQRGWHRALSDRLTELEAKQDSLTAR
jgi:hypothetical protein